VAVKIKLKRMGKVRTPQYRIVIADARTKRDGRAIEEIGIFHPKVHPSLIQVNSERAQYWLSVGAQPTEPVRAILRATGDWQKFKGLPGADGKLQTAPPKGDKRAAYDRALTERHGEPVAEATTPRRTRKPEQAEPAADQATSDAAAATTSNEV
jgi:small subunit ribosomal protein S16